MADHWSDRLSRFLGPQRAILSPRRFRRVIPLGFPDRDNTGPTTAHIREMCVSRSGVGQLKVSSVNRIRRTLTTVEKS